MVGVGSALGVRVLVVGGVPAVRAVHAVLAAGGRQVRQAVVMDVQIVFGRAVRLGERRREREKRGNEKVGKKNEEMRR